MYVCVCTYVVEYVCVYMYVCVCMYVCMHACIYAYMHMCMCACMYACACMCVHVCVCMCVRVYVYMYACMHVCVYGSQRMPGVLFCHCPSYSDEQGHVTETRAELVASKPQQILLFPLLILLGSQAQPCLVLCGF